jgi:hypothetical protein
MLQSKQKRTFIKDYDDPALRSTAYELTTTYRNKEVDAAMISREFATDSYIMHSEDWKNILFNPKSSNAWSEALKQYYETQDYRRVNENVSGDGILSKLATMSYLDKIVGVAQQYSSTNQNFQQPPQQNQGQQGQNGQQPGQQGNQGNGQQPFNLQVFFDQLSNVSQNPNQKNLAASVMRGIAAAGQQAAQEAEALATVALGFSHYGLPILKFGDPDELRATLSNRVIIALLKVLKKLGSTDGGKNGAQPSPRRGIPIGNKRMASFSEIPDIQFSEMLNPLLFSNRLINKKVQVKQRFSSMSDYLVYIDVSGSMNSGRFEVDGQVVPNISYAAACVIAMAIYLEKNGGNLIMKPFGSSVYDPITDKIEIIKTCLKLQANDGTNLTKVLEDSLYYKDYKVIIVSDGIDHIQDEGVIRRAAKNDLKAILLNSSAPQLEKYFPVMKVSGFSGNFLMKV